MSKQEVDKDVAKTILEIQWQYVENNHSVDFLDDEKYREELEWVSRILDGKAKTFKYILVNAALAKAANPDIHYRALQRQSTLEGAYDARSLGHDVLVPFEKLHGERLGGSNEPFVSKPARFPEVHPDNPTRNRDELEVLYTLLQKCEEHAAADKEYPLAFLREVLKAFQELDPRRVKFDPPPVRLSFEKCKRIIESFLEVSGGGERLVVVSAALLDAIISSFNGDMSLKAYPTNWADTYANTAGDIEAFLEEERMMAVEVKDKPLTESDIPHAIMKAKEFEITEYLIIVGAGISKGNEDRIEDLIENYLDDGFNLYVWDFPKDVYSILKVVREDGRREFISRVGYYLNHISASMDSKTAWKETLSEN